MVAAVIAGATIAIAPATPAHAQEKPGAAAASKTATAQRTFATPQERREGLGRRRARAAPRASAPSSGPASTSWLVQRRQRRGPDGMEEVPRRLRQEALIRPKATRKAVLSVGEGRLAVSGADGEATATVGVRRQRRAARRSSIDASGATSSTPCRRCSRSSTRSANTRRASRRQRLRRLRATFRSHPGKKDGLYWATKAGEPPSPLGPARRAGGARGLQRRQQGQAVSRLPRLPLPHLTAQGKDAPGGAYDYMVGGKLFGGFAVVAWPARYGIRASRPSS